MHAEDVPKCPGSACLLRSDAESPERLSGFLDPQYRLGRVPELAFHSAKIEPRRRESAPVGGFLQQLDCTEKHDLCSVGVAALKENAALEQLCPGETAVIAEEGKEHGRPALFRHYEGGFRLKIYAHDYSEDSSNPQLRFPGIIDLTVGQNEYVTGGIFHGPVVHIGGSLPVPKLDGWYAFGSGDFALQKNISEPQILFTQAGGNITLSSSNVFVVPTPQPNRDRYMLGVGIDIYHLIAKYKSGGSKSGQ